MLRGGWDGTATSVRQQDSQRFRKGCPPGDPLCSTEKVYVERPFCGEFDVDGHGRLKGFRAVAGAVVKIWFRSIVVLASVIYWTLLDLIGYSCRHTAPNYR